MKTVMTFWHRQEHHLRMNCNHSNLVSLSGFSKYGFTTKYLQNQHDLASALGYLVFGANVSMLKHDREQGKIIFSKHQHISIVPDTTVQYKPILIERNSLVWTTKMRRVHEKQLCTQWLLSYLFSCTATDNILSSCWGQMKSLQM